MYRQKCALTLAPGVLAFCVLAGTAFAADSIKGQVMGGGAPIAKSTVTLWEASADAPKQLAQTKTSDDGRFEVRAKGAKGDAVLYLVASGGVPKASKASGDNPAIVLLAVVGNNPPASVTINDWTSKRWQMNPVSPPSTAAAATIIIQPRHRRSVPSPSGMDGCGGAGSGRVPGWSG